MKTISAIDFKANFSEVIDSLKNGEEIAIAYGKKKETVGVLVPIAKYKKSGKLRTLGILSSIGSFSLAPDFKMTTEEFLGIE